MSLIIKGMEMPKHAAVNGEKDTAYKCVILAHPDNSVELVIDTKFSSAYNNGHNIQRYPITELPTPHGRLIDAEELKEDFVGLSKISPELKRILGGVVNVIDGAPTVIEAEVSE